MKKKLAEKLNFEVSAEPCLSESEPASEITLRIVDRRSTVTMSPAEARELARQLLAAEQIAQTVKEPPSQEELRHFTLLIDNQVFPKPH